MRCLSSQRYNILKANQNLAVNVCNGCVVVYQVKDTIFWKQITTSITWIITPMALFIKSKIQFFESKSQLPLFQSSHPWRCLSSQRYNFLKANHNNYHKRICSQRVVYQVKDTIFWKQITTSSMDGRML